MPVKDLDILRHQEWLGLLQPVGLVVSPPALIKAQAVIDRGRLVDLQERLREVISTEAIPRHKDDGISWIENFPAFTQKVLDWRCQLNFRGRVCQHLLGPKHERQLQIPPLSD